MANGDGGVGVVVVVVDGTAKNCEIDERFSYSRFNAGKLEATALEDRIGEKGFSAIERFFFNRGRPRVYGPMVYIVPGFHNMCIYCVPYISSIVLRNTPS